MLVLSLPYICLVLFFCVVCFSRVLSFVTTFLKLVFMKVTGSSQARRSNDATTDITFEETGSVSSCLYLVLSCFGDLYYLLVKVDSRRLHEEAKTELNNGAMA